MSGFVALALTREFGLILFIIALLSTVAGFAVDRFAKDRRWYRWLWNVLALCYMLFLVVDLTILSQLVVGMVHLLVFVQIVKCFNSKGRGDYVQIYLLSFFQLLASATLDIGPGFAIALTLFLLTMMRALILFNMVCTVHLLDETGYVPRAGRDFLQPRRWRWRLATVTGVFATAILLGTTALFCIIPRVKAGFLQRTGPAELMLGFDEKVDLRRYGTIYDNSTVALRVGFPDYPEGYTRGPLFWKGFSLDVYADSRWSQINRRGRGLRRSERQLPESERTGILSMPRSRTGDLVRQEITVENMQGRILFGLPNINKIAGPFDSAIWDYIDGSWQLESAPRRARQLKYSAYSQVDRPSPEQLRAASDIDEERLEQTVYIDNAVLWIEGGRTSRRVVALAQRVTSDAPTSYDKAVAISNHLRQNYTYLLNMKRTSEAAPLEDFLFYTRAGHCQYMATAMAIMLRATGVPARIATGYRGGTWLASDRVYVVRENDAHVWVEVFFPEYGWVEFDPSPIQAGDRGGSWVDRVIARMMPYKWRLEIAWARHVVGYDREAQTGLAIGIGAGANKWRSALRFFVDKLRIGETRLRGGWRYIEQSYVPAWVLAVVLALLLVSYFVGRRREILRHTTVTPGTARHVATEQRRAVMIYGKMLRVLEYKRLVKPPSWTPGEFSRDVALRWPDGAPFVKALTEIYYTLRYARPSDTQPLIVNARRELKELHRRVQPNWLTRRI